MPFLPQVKINWKYSLIVVLGILKRKRLGKLLKIFAKFPNVINEFTGEKITLENFKKEIKIIYEGLTNK
jgi:benzoyl-CoA reductase/2-hydroxyglutaryl-CoA dehydratase subunit BcrC/BadD/HgdB